MDNREWMYNRWLPNGGVFNKEFIDGVESLIEFAKSQVHFMDGEKIKCPCLKCMNGKFQDIGSVCVHLYRKGFVDN